jgi:DNA-binding response OmpR family regulator
MQAKILVIDDEQDLRDALRISLEAAGYAVIDATNGAEGLEKALRNKPSLILLDIMMPHMNGHQVLRELRKDDWGKNVPVLLLTNADDASNITHGVSFRSDDYIIKSQTSLKEIVTRVKQYLAGYHD